MSATSGPAPEPSRLNGYSFNPLDRESEARDATSVARALADGRARLYLFAGERIVFAPASGQPDPLFTLAETCSLGADLDRAVLLGRLGGAPRLAATLAPQAAEERGLVTSDLRSMAVEGLVPPEHLGPLAQAKSLLDWHARHGFCARCGAATTMGQGGYRRDCPACEAQHFPRTDPVVIMLAVHGERALLARQARFAPGVFSALAGFVEPGETIEDAVRREIKEEAGVTLGAVRYYSSQPWPFPSSLMIGCHAQTLEPSVTLDHNELEEGRWFSRDELRTMIERRHEQGLIIPPPIAIAHQLIRAFVERGEGVLG